MFKLLVTYCPSALLWEIFDSSQQQVEGWSMRCIDKIAGGFGTTHRNSFDILIWLAHDYGWIFSLTENFAIPAHNHLLSRYIGESSANVVDALSSFFMMQPNFMRIRGHNHDIHEYPINIVLKYCDGAAGDLDPLIRSMASNFPESLRMQDPDGSSALHHACESLATAAFAVSPNETKIKNCCRAVAVLVEQYPQAVSLTDEDGCNPIECLLTGEEYNPDYQDTLILLLRAYYPYNLTQCMAIDDFVRKSYTLVEEEARFGRLCVSLKSCSKIIEKFAQLAGPSDNSTSGLGSAEDDNDNGPHVIHQTYSLWASKHIVGISAKFESEYARLKNEFATVGPENQA